MNRKNIIYKIILVFTLLLSSIIVSAQCNTSINTIPSTLDTINCGESIPLEITLPVNALGDDFSSGSLGSIWQTSTALNYTVVQNVPNGCSPPVYCSNPQPNWVFWFTGGPAGWLTTNDIDIQCPGTISLDYRHETQSPQPCDGPDQPNEGLYLEFKPQGGIWQTINYWVPVNSGGNIQQHCWNNYSFPITPAMYSPATQFRVGTQTTSSANWDQWGMSNFNVSLNPPCGVPYTSVITGPNVPINYTLDTITVTPLTDSAIYIVNVTDGVNNCSDSITVYVEQPSIDASVIPALCAGSDTLNATATITKRCTYSIVLRNYKSGGPNFPGWGTGQPAPNDYNYVDFYRNGVLNGYFTMGSGGQNATDTFPLPLVDGDLIEANFSGFGAQGPSGQECYYYIYDSQMNQVAATTLGPTPNSFFNTVDVNITSGGNGYNIPPWNAINPQPTCVLTGGGGTYTSCVVNGVAFPNGNITSITVNGAVGYTSAPTLTINGTNTNPAITTVQLNGGSNPLIGNGITVTCPTSNTYTYAWTNISTIPPSTTGLSNPNISNPVSTVATPTSYQVIASDNNNAQCVAIDTVQVPGNPGNGNFDVSLTSPNTICNNGSIININFKIESNSVPAINSGMFTFDLEDGNGNIIAPSIPFDAALLPYNSFVPASALPNPLIAGIYNFTITNIQDAIGCPIAVNNPTITITVNDPPNTGNPPVFPIELCTSNPITDTLWNSWLTSPNQNGTWTYLGVPPVGIASTLPFNGFQYSLNPSNLGVPVGQSANFIFQYQAPTINGCPAPTPAQITLDVTYAPDAGNLPSVIPPMCINDPVFNTGLNLNSLFTSSPSTLSTIFWTDASYNNPNPVSYLFIPDTARSYTLRYTAPISGNCPADYEEVSITVYDKPEVTLSTSDPNNTICDGDPIYLSFGISYRDGPTAPNYLIDYIDPSGNAINSTVNAAGNDAATNLPIQIFPIIGANPYTITSITDNNNCSNTAQQNIIITVIQPPNAGNTTINKICSDDFTTHNLNGAPFFTNGDVGGSWTYQGVNPPIPNAFGTFQAWDPILNIPVDPFGIYRYTVSDPTNTCPDAWQDITINIEQAPNTGTAVNTEICINDYNNSTLFNLSNLLIGQDPGGTWYFNGTALPNSIDPNDPTYGFVIGAPGNALNYVIDIAILPPGSICNNNGTNQYITQSILTIHPEPVIDPLTFINNPPIPASVPQGTSTTITIDMLVGTPPFLVNLQGNETPQSSASFNILAMSGAGTITPNYDINTNPVTISIDEIEDANGCIINPVINTDIYVEPWPLISANTSVSVCEETGVLDLIVQALQGAVPLTVFWEINGVTQTNMQIGSLATPTPFSMSIPGDLNRIAPGPVNTIVITSIIDAAGNTCPPNLLPTNTNPIEVIVNPTPIISSLTIIDGEICEGEDAVLEFNFSKGTPPFNINLNANVIPAINGTTNQLHTISPQLTANTNPYNYLVTFCQDDNGCVSSSNPSISVIVHPEPEISINPFIPNEICAGENAMLNLNINTSIIPVNPQYTVEFNPGPTSYSIDQNGNILSLGTPIIKSPITTTDYTIINFYDEITGCGIISTINNNATLTVNETPDLEITYTPEICAGEKSFINFIFEKGTSPWTIDYNNNGIPVTLGPWSDTTTIQQILTSTTNYDFQKITDNTGCFKDLGNIHDFSIIVNPLPIASLNTDNRFICKDSEVTLKFEVSSGNLPYKVNYQVNLDAEQIPDSIGYIHTIDTNITGTYSITKVTDSKGCEATEKGGEIEIFVNPLPIADFMLYNKPANIYNTSISFVNLSKDNEFSEENMHISYLWESTNNDLNYPIEWNKMTSSSNKFEHIYPTDVDTHYVTLTVTSDSGCIAIHEDTVIIESGFSIFIPDAFTPDNDLYNDYFLPIVNGVEEYILQIYDRQGNKIFETTEYISQDCPRGCDKKGWEDAYANCVEGCNAAWDGKVNDKFLNTGKYIYNIVLTDLNGKARNFNGSITLIR